MIARVETLLSSEVVVVAILLGLVFFWIFLRTRRAAPTGLQPESQFIVHVSESDVACERPDGTTELTLATAVHGGGCGIFGMGKRQALAATIRANSSAN
jgi:hypothetical protein